MSDTTILVENLSKCYRLGLQEQKQDTLAGSILAGVKQPLHNLRHLRRLTRFAQGEQEADDVLWAVKDVSFEVQTGEVVGVIGRNGAGKSTLLKILARITHPTSGRIELRGQVSSLLEVGTGFHPDLTGRENVYLNGTILGMRKAEIDRKFDEIVEFSGVEKFLDTQVKHYSSGMKVRLAFAVAAHLEPEIMLVDEVLAVGDSEFQRKCLGKMGEVARNGRTVLFVSHNMGAVQALCTRAMVMNAGEIFFNGDLNTAIGKYLALFDSSSNTDLRDRKDRDGSGEVRFSDAYLLNTAGKKVFEIMTDEPVNLVLYTGSPAAQVRNVNVMVTIYDPSGYAITHLNNKLTGEQLDLVEGCNTYHCLISGFPFRPGSYSVNLSIGKDGDTFDHVERAFQFDVIDNNYFGTGKSLTSNVAPLLVHHNWKC